LAPKGENQKNLLYRGGIKRKKIIGGKNKLVHITGGYQPIYPKI
jgi:hypothetical protein